MTTVLRVNPTDLEAKHRANIAASLARRLEAARAAQNTHLVAMLEQEQKQLLKQPTLFDWATLRSQIRQLWQTWRDAIERQSQLSVERVVDRSGVIWWHAYDPQTGKALYAESESEVMQWIEDNHLGR